MHIDLISDTVTRPSPGMLKAMMSASVGDDVFHEDPTVNELEAKIAALFGHEKALFCPSGTMTNQIAVKIHTQDLDEVIMDATSHIYLFELGGYAFNSRVAIHLVNSEDGRLNAEDVSKAIKPKVDWMPNSKLVIIENSINRAGGNYYTLEDIKPIQAICKEKGLRLHLDGARLFNVLVETGESTLQYGKLFDTISICLSKGLGAPVGSCLIGSSELIAKARKIRKVMGGGMRQAGFLAAAGIYALDHNIARLKEDNDHAKQIGNCLSQLSYIKEVKPVKTNIVIFSVKPPMSSDDLIKVLAKNQIRAVTIGPGAIRFVTHLDFTEAMCDEVIRVLKELE
ncbi:MAG: aminotransferase class I/II-fold pyridoxal phosphate-dependent enzyme [Saprospiraceae bacterium]|nr:aminotransferase class I/II-fold pyridoxal phosphate-dependent enzyme [Saprospiraceae bacterium]